MSYYVLHNTLSGLGEKITNFRSRTVCPSLKDLKENPWMGGIRSCCEAHGFASGTPVTAEWGEGDSIDCWRRKEIRAPLPRTGQRRPGLFGLGNGVLCADVPWTNQLGGTGTAQLCPSGDTCGDVIAMQQALNDLGFPCDVTGLWEPSTATALNNWRAANGYPKNFNVAGTSQDCTLITQQWTALKGAAAPAPAADAPSAVRPMLSKVGAKMAITSSLSAKLRAIRDATAKPTSTTQSTTTEDVTPAVQPEKAGWWASQSATTRYAIIGGGVLIIAGGVYLAVK
jgi:hypothetical protein